MSSNGLLQSDENRRQRAADLLKAESATHKKQSGRDYLPTEAKPDPRGRDIDLDKITGILGGGEDSGDPPRAKDSRSRQPDADDPDAGRAESSKPARPALELDDDYDEDNIDKPLRRKPQPKTIQEFADERELDPKEIYGLRVPSSDEDGEPITVGQMKDKLAEVRALQSKADDFEDSRSEAMNQIFVARQQIDNVLQRIKEAIPADKFARIFSEVSENEQHQLETAKRQVREFFPEWRDAAVMARDREALTKHLGSYGFSRIEVDTLRDARLIKYAMDAMRLVDRYRRVKAQKKDEPPTRDKPSTRKPPRQNVDQTAKHQAEKGDVLGAVETLLR